MRAHTPQGQGDGSGGGRRESAGASRFRASLGGIPRPQKSLRESIIGSARAAPNQPSYNLFTGEPSIAGPRPPSQQDTSPSSPYAQSQRAASRESSKENMAPPDAEGYEAQRRRIEELKAELGTLRYTMSTHEQEKEMTRLQHEGELRDVQRRAEEDFKLRQATEGEKASVERKLEALQGVLESGRAEQEGRQRELERKAREAQDEARLLQEQLEDLSAAKDDAARMSERRITELQGQVTTAQRILQEAEQGSDSREAVLQQIQAQLAEKDAVIGNLEADVLRLKAQTGDAQTMEVIRRELTDQVNHIRSLEASNQKHVAELKHLRQVHKAVEVVEEEKRSLQRKLASAEAFEVELVEERIHRQRLEEQQRAWSTYLRKEDGHVEFDSPEAVARALIQERCNTATVTERLGAVNAEIAQRESDIQSLEKQNKDLDAEIKKLKASNSLGGATTSADKVRMRLERHHALALKEVALLRAQLSMTDTEDSTMEPEKYDEARVKRISELEALVDSHREELETLRKEMAALEVSASSTSQPAPVVGNKRPRPDDMDEEPQSQLAHKSRKLQHDLSELQSAHRLLEKEYAVAQEQLAATREASKTRVLQLRDNPTSTHQAAKQVTLDALRTENTELLAHIQSKPASYPTIPISVLVAAQREIEEAKAKTASAEKLNRRLREVFSAKSHEFREAITATLGWDVTFIPNGKMRVESLFSRSVTDDMERSIVFDGERGTMKVGGGPQSEFAREIEDSIVYWVREKGSIPGLLAALTMEFVEREQQEKEKS